MPMQFTLPEYVNQERLPLIKKAVLGAKTVSLINVQTDVKKSAAINIVDADPQLQAGGCGWTDAGYAKLTQRVIDTKLLKVNQSFCDKDFLNYWTNYEVKVGVGKENLPFEEYFTGIITDKVNASIENMIWQGNGSTNQFKGLLTTLSEDGAMRADTEETAYEAIMTVYKNIPVAVLDKAVIFVGADTFRSFMLAMVDKNYFHYPADGAAVQEFIIPGTNTKVIAVNGLNGSKTVVAADPANIFYGCDMLNDTEVFDLWYSKDNREYRLAIQFNAGVQVAFPDEVVWGTYNA